MSGVRVRGLAVLASDGRKLFGPNDFDMEPGTVTALTGPSGSGKTTLMRLLLGQRPPGATVEGALTVAGHDVLALDPAALRRFRRTAVAYVAQDPGSALNPLLRVRTLLAEVAADRASIPETLRLVGLDETFLSRRSGTLSGGQQRRVALARALVRRTGVLVLDEPFAGLHGALRTEIAALVQRIARERGVAVLLSGHDTATVHGIADQVIELGSAPAVSTAVPPDEGPTGDIVLRATGLTARADGVQILTDVDLELAAGSALAVVGASGAGKTTLARVLAGLHTDAGGTLELHGERTPLGPRGIQLVTQNPRSALNPRRTVAQTIGRPLRRVARVPRADLPRRITDLLTAVDLPADLAPRRPHELSGGQRQRVALARALAAEPAVLICDEITTALDHATATAVLTLLAHLRTRGTTLLVISHDIPLVATFCPYTLVLDQGKVVEYGRTRDLRTAPQTAATRALLA
ncbi:ABC transporter ATP-binding protein [Nocardia harenae]|uniref:ABC transporter ATP-binding protein n=1 Tax=Nocardia harenae TaxID=358707 RepID=UPI00082E73ED|nr:ATP-binding cassette domain-containing protein [Nocardia harenae]